MTPDVVVDVGNSRIKWGWSWAGGREIRSLPPDDPAVWADTLAPIRREKGGPLRWAVAGVHPERRDRFAVWAGHHGTVAVIDDWRKLPIEVDVDEPDAVGIDRLLNAVGFWPHLGSDSNTPGIVIDVGTAVTIDLILEGRRFVGGAILPGPRLMADGLHRHTAKLPLVDLGEVPNVDPPGRNTRDAIAVGVMAAVLGAAEFLVREYTSPDDTPPWVMMTGGALGGLADLHFEGVGNVLTDPHLTLDGIRRAAMELP